jgi:glycosidase
MFKTLLHSLAMSLVLLTAAPAADAAPACKPAPLGDVALYLRGTMTNWTAPDDFAFQYRCDAYYLNVKLEGAHEFKIADEAWTPSSTFTQGEDGRIVQGSAVGANLRHRFTGEHTLKLAFDKQGQAQFEVGPKTFVDPLAAALTDPRVRAVRFDSRSPADKRPFGAVTAGSRVSFSFAAPGGLKAPTLVVSRRLSVGNDDRIDYTELARVPMQRRGDRWVADYRFVDVAVYGYHFEFSVKGRDYVLQNNADTVYWTREKGSMGAGVVAFKPDSARRIRRYRQTVYTPDFKVPDWARDVVYYYIFPERFRNGDPSNDPRPGGGRAQDRYQDHDVERHAHWNEKPFKPGTGDGSDAVYNNDFFGGDLAGIIEKLDYIRDLGANAIYMTPVFRAPSNHKYDTADYKQIDPAFGSNEDFVRLCAEAAKRGIRVIPDTSLNHVGSDSPYFNRFGNFPPGGAFDNGKINPASPYYSWFKFHPEQTDVGKQYTGWVGVEDLPEIDKSSPSFRAYAYGDKDSVTRTWLDRGAAGWRMDVAPWVPDDFWREWRNVVKSQKPDALTISETWFDASKHLLGDMFDSTMNYIFRNAVLDYAGGKPATQTYCSIELMREAYPPQAFYALMNLLSTHDQARALWAFGYKDDGNAEALALAKRRLRLAVFFQAIFPGSPTIYYGDEVGLGGGDDPFNRAPYPWTDQGGQPDLTLHAEFKRLFAMRHALPVLRHGSLTAPLHLDEHVVVLLRRDGDTLALTATNNSEQPRSVRVELPSAIASLHDALDGSTITPQGRVVEFTVPPLFGRVLTTQ